MNLSESLTEWLKTFEINGNFNCAQDLCDGFIIASILNQVLPDFFTPQWLAKIDNDTGTDWRLREHNLRKIFDKLIDYYREMVDKPIPESLSPNVTKIAMFHNEHELGLLLQLVLGCVINGPNRLYFIDIMNGLSVDIQHGLKIAIQNLDETLFEQSFHSAKDGNTSTIDNSNHEEELDFFRQKCQELENLVDNLKEEIYMNAEDSEKLKDEANKQKKYIQHLESQTMSDKQLITNLKRNVDTMKDELLNVEESKERMRAKYGLIEIEVKNLRQEIADLKYNRKSSDNDDKDRIRFLEEELNRAKEINHLQIKRIDELKNKLMISEKFQKSDSNDTSNGLSDEAKNENAKLKKQLQELRLKIGEEIHRADKAEDNYTRINEKYRELIKENDEYMNELQRIKEECNRLRTDHKNKSNSIDNINDEIHYTNASNPQLSPLNASLALNFIPFQSHSTPTMNIMFQNQSNKTVVPQNQSDLPNDYSSTSNNVHYLRQLLQQKDKQMELLRQEYSTRESFRDKEERLILSAFHKLSLELQRKCSAERQTNRLKEKTFLHTQRQSVKMSTPSMQNRFGSTQTSLL